MKAQVELGFETALPLLISLWRRSVLTPFLGAGMSAPALHLWTGFLKKLCQLVGEQYNEPQCASSSQQVIAERAAHRINALAPEARRACLQSALLDQSEIGKMVIPPQTQALANLYWPLVISTNYDDLYFHSRERRAVEICGRGRYDCHRVLRSLDENSSPLLWAIQGFVGGQKESLLKSIPQEKMDELLKQVVLGHQHYVRASNAEPHFRRTFAEVFRRRSLLFIGSRVDEDYFINLFSEIIHHHGLGIFPHFALVDVRNSQIDPWFLQTRLGITVIRYGNYDQLPDLLARFADLAAWNTCLPGSQLNGAHCALTELCYPVTQVTTTARCSVRFSFGELPPPNENEATVVSVGRQGNLPLSGKLAKSHLRAAFEKKLVTSPDPSWRPLGTEPAYTFVHTNCDQIFAVAARLKSTSNQAPPSDESMHHDIRDLRIIPEAVCQTLESISRKGFKRIRLGAVAAGKRSPFHPSYSLTQTISGIRKFLRGDISHIQEIVLHLVDPSAWSLIASNKIPISEMLASDICEYRIEVYGACDEVDCLRISYEGNPSVAELLHKARLCADDWLIHLEPDPISLEPRRQASGDEVVPNSVTVVLKPRL
jgi:hypothetical protein